MDTELVTEISIYGEKLFLAKHDLEGSKEVLPIYTESGEKLADVVLNQPTRATCVHRGNLACSLIGQECIIFQLRQVAVAESYTDEGMQFKEVGMVSHGDYCLATEEMRDFYLK